MSLEICIIVDKRITAQNSGKADAVNEVEGSSPECDKASTEDTTGVEERGMPTEG